MTSPPPLPRMHGAVPPCTPAPHVAPVEMFAIARIAAPYSAYSGWSGGGRSGSTPPGAPPRVGGGSPGGCAGAVVSGGASVGSADAAPAPPRTAATTTGRSDQRAATSARYAPGRPGATGG